MSEIIIIILYIFLVLISIIAGERIGYILGRSRKGRSPFRFDTPGWLNISIIIILPWLIFAISIYLTLFNHNVEKMVDVIPMTFLGVFFVTAIIVKYYEGMKKNK